MVSGSFLDFGYAAYPGPSNINIIDQNGKRERTKFNDAQLQQLEQTFRRCQYPQGHDREQLATRLGLTETKVQVWFKNRRAKQRANDKFDKLRQESALAQASSGNSKRLNAANNNNNHNNGENINMSGNSSTNPISSNGSGEFTLSSLDGKTNGLLSSNNSLMSKSTFGVNNNTFINNNNGIKDETYGSVGETEDENEGSTPVVKKLKTKNNLETRVHNTEINFPVSMPMIPMPAPGFDIKSFDAVSAVAGGNAASINAAAAAMAAAAAASNSPCSSSTNLWNFPYQNAYSQTTTQMFGGSGAKSFAAGNEFISSMAAASSFPLSHTGWMTTPNYTPSAMLNMNMITPTAYGFPTPTAHSPTTSIGLTNASSYYPAMPPSVSIAAAYDLYNQQAYYSSSTNSL